ncbi:MAG: HAD-IIIA family hydrolase [Betaproteobacteria bacterium]|jgi:phosphoglycolate phosphatase
MRRYDFIVFDWDGTLSDSAALIVRSIQGAARDNGLAVPSDEQSRHIIGLGLQDAMEYLFPDLPAERYRDITDRYRVHYLGGEQEVVLFEGVMEGLAALRDQGHLLAVATGKSRVGLDRALASTGVGAFMHGSRCGDEGFSKPHPEMLEVLLDQHGVSPERALMVGDTSHDVNMAHAAGVHVAAVSFGAHDVAKLESSRPTFLMHSPRDLWDWLTQAG